MNEIALKETIAYHEEHIQYDRNDLKEIQESINNHIAEIKRCNKLLE